MSRCQNCGKAAEGPRDPRYCSDRCRAIAWRNRRAASGATRDSRIRLLLAEAMRELGGKGE